MVHESRLAPIIAAGKRYFDYVDYRSLPIDLQVRVISQQKSFPWIEDSELNSGTIQEPPAALYEPFENSPRAVLFVAQNAPWEVVRAAYKALAVKYHPDTGGSPEAFRRVQEAYEALQKEREERSGSGIKT